MRRGTDGAESWLEVHRIWIRIRIRPDPNSLDPVNRIHYHVVPIIVSMHCVLSPNAKMTQICLVYCLLWFDVLWFDVLINNNSKQFVAIQLWSGLGYIQIRIRWRSGSGRILKYGIRCIPRVDTQKAPRIETPNAESVVGVGNGKGDTRYQQLVSCKFLL